MARPSKSTDNLNWHITKSELAQRKSAERVAVTGLPLREAADVAADEIAHAEFIRVSDILTRVGKNDALYEPIINRYCRITADVSRTRKLRNSIEKSRKIATVDKPVAIQKCEKMIRDSEKDLLIIEKEMCFTVTSVLNSIPKKPQTKSNPLLEALNGSGD